MEPVEIRVESLRKRRHSSGSESVKKIIASVHDYLKEIKQGLLTQNQHSLIESFNLMNIASKVAELCDVHERTVYNAIKKEEDKENCVEHSKEIAKPIKNLTFKCDAFIISMIRRITQEFYSQKHYPTLKLILNKCLENENFPKISVSTLQRWLIKYCKFKYKRVNRKPVYMERNDIVVQRHEYLIRIEKYRKENYKIFYSDETWVNPDQSRNMCWYMHLSNDERKELDGNWLGHVLQDMDGWAGGFKVKSGNGRIILNHIGSVEGFLEGGMDLFICKKDTQNYHNSMNFDRYIAWFKRILNLVPDKSILVLDQAPYHKKRVPGTTMPQMSWRKAEILAWLVQNKVDLPEGVSNFSQLTKPHLIQLSKSKPIKVKYIVEELCENCGKDVRVLWLPVGHCEFNPIELVWANVKGFVATNNNGKNLQEMFKLTQDAVKNVGSNLWKNCISHVQKYERTMKIRDHIMDENFEQQIELQRLIIPVRVNDTTTDDDSEIEINE